MSLIQILSVLRSGPEKRFLVGSRASTIVYTMEFWGKYCLSLRKQFLERHFNITVSLPPSIRGRAGHGNGDFSSLILSVARRVKLTRELGFLLAMGVTELLDSLN